MANLRRLHLALAALLVVSPCLIFSAPALAEKRVALVIGNGAYQNATPLPNPPNDAHDVAAALSHMGFDTSLGIDLDRAGMDRAAVKFARAARDAEVRVPLRILSVEQIDADHVGVKYSYTRPSGAPCSADARVNTVFQDGRTYIKSIAAKC